MNSSRLLQVTATIATLAFIGYVLVTHVIDWDDATETNATTSDTNASLDSKRDILSYVPADTIYFFGGLEPAPLKNMLDIFAVEWSSLQHANLKQDLAMDANTPPAVKMLTGLFIEYLNAFKDIKTLPATLGVGDELDAALYSVGTIPVMRIKLTDVAAFNTYVQNAETSAQVAPVQESHGAISLKTYSFNTPDEKASESPETKLAISVDSNYALITLLTPLETQETRDVILGATKPANPLTHTSILQDLKSKYGFHPAYLGYINHQEIMAGLTAPEGNEFGRMLGELIKTINQQQAQNQLAAQAGTAAEAASQPDSPLAPHSEEAATPENEPTTEDPLAPMQTAACQSELQAITKMWPRTIFGYTELGLTKKPRKMTARMVVENTDAAFMQQLQKLRGFIPAHLRTVESKPVLGLGLGFNVDEITPVVNKIIGDITQKEYQCQMLADMKQKLLASNPMLAMGMMTGMAAGVQGISATVLNIDGTMNFAQAEAAPDIRSIDAMVTLSAKEPQRLLLMAANFMQGMPPIQVPADGSAVDLPIPLPIPNLGSIKLAQKGQHLVAYIGARAEQLAQTMSDDPLAATGTFTFNMDFAKYMKFVTDAALAAEDAALAAGNAETAGAGLSELDKATLKEMAKMDMQVVESFDITPEGISFDATMEMN